ncbi:MAG: ABC transporter permease [Cytophagales bacterium]
MFLFLRLSYESFRFAFQALKANLLRTILSLLGVTIGIFAIITVFTVVDSLEKSVKESLSFLGDKVIYIEKWPYEFKPGDPWWDFLKRPVVEIEEFDLLGKRLQNSSAMSFFVVRGSVNSKYKNSSTDEAALLGVTFEQNKVSDIRIAKGRYFTQREIDAAVNVAIIGSKIKEQLFGDREALGKTIKVVNRKFYVIGVMEKQGENILNAPSNDTNIFIPLGSFAKIFKIRGRSGTMPRIAVKGFEDDLGLIELENEIRGNMRRIRGLKPKEKDNFAINRPEMLANIVTSVFDVIGIGGWIIGGFSILVGGFGIANIMFVSVKERTNLIGIQKSLGAKNFFILFQFLFEALFLSIIGGAAGLFLVYLVTFAPTGALNLTLSFKNIVLGLGVAGIVGVFSGIFPAVVAARLDPVIAIRSK